MTKTILTVCYLINLQNYFSQRLDASDKDMAQKVHDHLCAVVDSMTQESDIESTLQKTLQSLPPKT